MVDAARIVRVGRPPDRDPRRDQPQQEHEGDGGDREEDGVTANRMHPTMLATALARIAPVPDQTMRIDTASDENPTAAEDRNVPRVLATVPNRYEPGDAIANER